MRKRPWYQTVEQDVRVLWHVFPWRSAGLVGAFMLVMALGVQQASRVHDAEESLSFVQALYAVGMMLQLQYDLPAPPQLDVYLVLVPALGLPLMLIFGLDLFRVLRIFFVREERGQLWQGALIATLPAPIVVFGLGRVGYRVAQLLHTFHQRYPHTQPPVVGIDLTPSPLTDHLIRAGVPVIYGDIRSEEVLRQAGVARAKAVIVCTNQDMVNIDAILRVRELNPQARLVLRLFDDALAPVMERAFGVKRVISRSAYAAGWFVESALGHGVLEELRTADGVWQVQRVSMAAGMSWLGLTPAEVEAQTPGVHVLIHARPGMTLETLDVPAPLQIGDDVYVVTPAAQNPFSPDGLADNKVYIVGGLGHTGYRVALSLRQRGMTVTAVDERDIASASALLAAGVRVLRGDFREPAVLERAGIRQAAALILCAERGMANLEAALRARELNPAVRVVMRLFEDELALRLTRIFAFNDVHSTSAIAAPAFVAATFPTLPPVHPVIGMSGWYLVKVTLSAKSAGLRIADFTARRHGRVLVHAADTGRLQVAPDPATVLRADDHLLLLMDEAHLVECTDV